MISIEQIKELRERTGAGVGSVREALESTNGDVEAAIKYLREKGIAKGEKRKDKVASNGILGTYIHNNNKLVVVVEVACETDFAANGEDMKKFARDLAIHIAAVNPKYVSVEAVDAETLKTEKEAAEQGLEGKPENIKESIIQGKLDKFFKETVLLKQSFFVDESRTVEDALNDMISKIGEKIQITQFYKVQVSQNPVISTIFGGSTESEE